MRTEQTPDSTISIEERHNKLQELIEARTKQLLEVESRMQTVRNINKEIVALLEQPELGMSLPEVGETVSPRPLIQVRSRTRAGAPKDGSRKRFGDWIVEAIKATGGGAPVHRKQIEEYLQKHGYTNSAKDPFKTLGNRLHRLEAYGISPQGNATFIYEPKKHKGKSRHSLN